MRPQHTKTIPKSGAEGKVRINLSFTSDEYRLLEECAAIKNMSVDAFVTSALEAVVKTLPPSLGTIPKKSCR